jgi:short-subunit dehydrogenase
MSATAGGPWRRALVTGASSGIGEAFADLLSGSGVDLVLVGRNEEALEAVADRARRRGVEVTTMAVDLADDADLARVEAMLHDGEPMIDLLVNNAGLGPAGPFARQSAHDLRSTMRVNNDALVRLSHAALPRMLDADRGWLIQISSSASSAVIGGQAVYVATKAFVTSFGQSLSAELAGTKIVNTTVLPSYTRTNYFERNGVTPAIADEMWVSAELVARESLAAAAAGQVLVNPGPSPSWLRRLSARFPTLARSPVGRLAKKMRALVASTRKGRSTLA